MTPSGDEPPAVTIDVGRYVRRIGFEGPTTPTAATLAQLQLAHMISVPFENLHVVHGARLRTDLAWSYPKVVEQGRGGWCFELNGAFGALLEAIGFPVTYLSASVWSPKLGELGPPLDHLCLVVVADDERWLVDVGFGDSSLTPLRFDSEDEQDRRPRRGRLERVSELVHYLEWVHGDWEVQYAIDLTPRTLTDFQPRSDALAGGAGDGHFSTKPFATRALDADGSRVWLLKDRFKRVDGTTIATGRAARRRHRVGRRLAPVVRDDPPRLIVDRRSLPPPGHVVRSPRLLSLHAVRVVPAVPLQSDRHGVRARAAPIAGLGGTWHTVGRPARWSAPRWVGAIDGLCIG